MRGSCETSNIKSQIYSSSQRMMTVVLVFEEKFIIMICKYGCLVE